MAKKLLSALAIAASTLAATAADFALDASSESLKVSFRGQEVITGSKYLQDGKAVFAPGELKKSIVTAPDGSKVYNFWSEKPEHRFRQEAVISADGSRVEISIQFDYQSRQFTGNTFDYVFTIKNNFFANKNFTVWNNRASATKEYTGRLPPVLNGAFQYNKVRVMALEHPAGGVLFDFNPFGVASGYDVGSMRGQWDLRGSKDGSRDFEFSIARTIPHYGFSTTGKLVLTAGDMQQYRKYHARMKYSYNDLLPAQKLYSFGAVQVGKRYTIMDMKKSDGTGDGWLELNAARVYTKGEPGAFYSAVGSGKKARLYLNGLEPGFYFITANIGNRAGVKNATTLKVNGEMLVDNVSVDANKAASITRVFKLPRGTAEITLEGDWLLSGLGVQQLISLYEDFSIERGFWYVHGFEPSVIMSDEEFKTPVEFKIGRTDFLLPDQDLPFAPKPLVYSSEQPAKPEKMDWRYNAVIGDMGPGNQGSFREFDAPGLVEKRLDDMKKNRINMVIVNGLLSRHTYPAQLPHVQQMIKRMAHASHERNMKLFDHIDYTLLWNRVAGFRVAAQDPQALARELSTMLPTTDYCPNNHARNARFRKELIDYILDTGIDGMMIDEVCYPGFDFCGCSDCRSDFYNDTGVYYPVNELAPDLPPAFIKASGTELDKLFRTWRAKKIGDWWVDTRRAIQPYKSDFSFFCYTTHYGLYDGWAFNRGGADLMQVGRGVDFLGTEIMSRNVWATSRAVSVFRKFKNMYRLEYGGPVFGLVYSIDNWDVSYYGWALNNMNAQVTWAEPLQCPTGKSNYYEFSDRNMDLKNAVNHADVALIFSNQGRNNGILMNYMQESFGTAQVLDTMHVSFDVINDMMLKPETLRRYKFVIAPACGPLSDEQIKMLKEYVFNGGHLAIVANTGCANDLAVLRKEWPFADIFGFERIWQSARVRKYTINGQEFVPVNPIHGFRPKGKVTGNAPMRLTVGNKQYPVYYSQPYGKGVISCLPFAIGQALHMPEGTVSRPLKFKYDAQLEKAYQCVLQSLLDQAQAGVWQCNAPGKVHTTLYSIKNSKLMYAHFLNATGSNIAHGEVITVGVPENGFPPLKKDITFTVKNIRIVSAEAASPDFEGWKTLKFANTADGATITLPGELLKVYTIVKITTK